MIVVSVFTNKGGDGKSTVTVGLAEFLAGNRNKRVAVLDLDAQASSACALLGHDVLRNAIAEHCTSVDMLNELRRCKSPITNLDRFLIWRPATDARGSSLAELAVMVPDGSRQLDLEERMDWRKEADLLLNRLKPALAEFDYVLLDLPGNLTRSSIGMSGLAMSDFVLIPVKATEMSLNGLPQTFDHIEYARTITGDGAPSVLGFLLNSTDRRYQQYKELFPQILAECDLGNLPPVFENVWPPSPALQTATASRHEFQTLKERFGKCYDHARKAAIEFDKRCLGIHEEPERPVKRSIWEKLGLA